MRPPERGGGGQNAGDERGHVLAECRIRVFTSTCPMLASISSREACEDAMTRHGQQEPRPVPAPTPAQTAPASAPKKILIVDDDAEVVEVLTRFFQTEPMEYDVQAVSNGEDALASLVVRTPDLVLLDINMPGMNGLEVMKHIDRHIAVIMVTGNVDSAPAEALKLGAFAYIPKPFDLAYVEQLVPLALMRRRPPTARIAGNV
jgi:CheY-like chemotaxis protein